MSGTPVPRSRVWICNIAAACIIATIGAVFWMAIDRDPPYEYLAGEILPPEPPIGTQVSVVWHVKVRRFCPGWVQRDVTDQRGYLWRNIGSPVKDISGVKPGDEVHLVNTFELPKQLGAGPATYQANVRYHCNPLQRWWPIYVSTPKLWFEIK